MDTPKAKKSKYLERYGMFMGAISIKVFCKVLLINVSKYKLSPLATLADPEIIGSHYESLSNI